MGQRIDLANIAYDPEYKPIYRLAQKYDVPVVFHTGDTYSPQAKVKNMPIR